MAAPRFVINGQEHEIPSIDTFTMGEAIILHDYSKLTLDQLVDMDGVPAGVIAAQLHVALARANPSTKAKEIKEMVESVNLMELLASYETGEEDSDADVPPAEPLPSEPDSSGELDESSERSGETSESTSEDRPVTVLRPTGTQD